MTKDEIDQIIIVSSKHETKPDFFEKKRKEFGCWSKDYGTALIDSFERLYTYLNEIDPYHYLLTKKDGRTSEHELNPIDDSYFDENFEFLMSLGEVSRPFKKYIELYIETNGEFKGKFTVEDLAGIKPELDAYCSWLKVQYPLDFNQFDNLSHKAIEKSEHITFGIKPIFKPETIQNIFDLLKDFFNTVHQKLFKDILVTGNDVSEQLIFLDHGNRLADAFKQFIKADIITGCNQRELEGWIYRNFKYKNRKEINSFTQRYLNDIISTNKDLCKNPILNVRMEKSSGVILINKV